MFKKIIVLASLVCFMSLQACGTIFKSRQIGKPHSNRFDVGIVALDALGLILFVVPGVMAFTVDYLNGTLYLPSGRTTQLSSTSPEYIQQALQENNIEISIDQIRRAQSLALNK